jgi:tight adherence protein B
MSRALPALSCLALLSAALLLLPPAVALADDHGGGVPAALTALRRLLRTRRGAAPGVSTTQPTLQLVEDLAVQVRAGAAPEGALRTALLVQGTAVGATPSSADEPSRAASEVIEEWAGTASTPAAVALLAAWRLSEDVGASLADVLESVAVGIRHAVELEGDVEVALAGPRATARLLAALPLAGLGLGQLLGASPVDVLLGTPVGWLCAVSGLSLGLLGQGWTRRLVRAART